MYDATPSLQDHLPEFVEFLRNLSNRVTAGEITNWDRFKKEVFQFFTPQMREKQNQVAPDWASMAACMKGTTEIHVCAVFSALYQLPEYQLSNTDLGNIAEWTVLFHDIGKQITEKKWRDHTHAFTSTSLAGRNLLILPFGLTANMLKLDKWEKLTKNAKRYSWKYRCRIQDNRRLPEITNGINQIFGLSSPAGLILRAILFHMSINVVEDWPQKAPLTPEEESRYLDTTLISLLKIMMLADSDAWHLFDPHTRSEQRQQTLQAFERLT